MSAWNVDSGWGERPQCALRQDFSEEVKRAALSAKKLRYEMHEEQFAGQAGAPGRVRKKAAQIMVAREKLLRGAWQSHVS